MNQELLLLLHAVWIGIVLLILYDVLRIFRGVIPHSDFWIATQDLCYWILSALYIFVKMYQENHGLIRCFVFAGILLGMLCYHNTVSPFFVSFFVRILKIPVKYIRLGIKRLKYGIKRCKISLHGQWSRRGHVSGWSVENKRLNKFGKFKKQTKKDKNQESSRDA